MIINRVDDVYGVTRDIPLNYVERESVDNKFIECLASGKHVVVYGSSKQGKTSLRRYSLKESDYILVQCQNTWNLDKLAEAILKEAGFRVEVSTSRTTSQKFKILAKFRAALLGNGGEAGAEYEGTVSRTVHEKVFEIDPSDPNDLTNALTSISFEKFILLEDFHYLPRETQENFSFFLKTIHERSKICFVIVAVWREENRLILLNGDLGGRVISVDADNWVPKELWKVVEEGENLLNIQLPDSFKEDLITLSLGSVYIVQEACRRACQESGIIETSDVRLAISPKHDAKTYVTAVVNESGARYKAFLTSFASGFQDTNLEMYKWILYPILISSIDNLEKGIKYRFIRETLQRVHPRGADLNPGNVTQALISVPALQSKKNIKPFVLDYDQTELRLTVVDRGFLIWLSTANIDEILEDLDLGGSI